MSQPTNILQPHERRVHGDHRDGARRWEAPGANGEGETIDEAKQSLRDAIVLIFEDRPADARRGLPDDVVQTVIAIG